MKNPKQTLAIILATGTCVGINKFLDFLDNTQFFGCIIIEVCLIALIATIYEENETQHKWKKLRRF